MENSITETFPGSDGSEANHCHNPSRAMMISFLEIFKRVSMVMSLTHHYLHQERFHQDPEELAMNPMWKRLLKV